MSSAPSYHDFLTSKRMDAPAVGFAVAPDALSPLLFDFQRDIVRWALQRGRAAIFASYGLGKTAMQLEWSDHVARHTGKPVLILAPLAVAEQTAREGEKFGRSVTVCEHQIDVQPGINVTNYEKLHHFDASAFGGIVLDECFAPDTPIDTPRGPVAIKDIRVGDTILNAAGVDVVADVHRREVPYLVRVTINGHTITSSPNHPYFTQRGWIGAQDLIPGDQVMATSEAMRMVQDPFYPALCSGSPQAILREILLSEMADASTGTPSESACAGSGQETGREETCLVCIGQSSSGSRTGTYSGAQSYEQSGDPRESLPPIESHPAQTFRAWGQWDGIDPTSTDLTGCSWQRLASGISFVTGQTDSGLSHALQDRHRQSQAQNRYRSGWQLSSQPQGSGPEEGCQAGFFRVDRLEVLESGHPDMERLRDADGKLYLYDLGATWHPSFSIYGCLVHNSSILKSFGGKVRRQITAFAQSILYRLCCSATPAPNDLIEITNHAEFLDIMGGKEIIALFFTQDGNSTHNWRLKGHAKADFWRWLASWSVAIRTPADLGYDDSAFQLPPLTINQITVDSAPPEDRLFVIEAQTLDERRKARKASTNHRVEAAAAIVNTSDDAFIVWCDLNNESAALTKAIPGAVEIRGSDTPAHKAQAMLDFACGTIRVLVTKPSIAGHGMNWQHCHRAVYVGLSDSWEQFDQSLHRIHRFGQQHPVIVDVITSEAEGAVIKNLERKSQQASEMMDELVRHMAGLSLNKAARDEMEYQEKQVDGENYTLFLGDSVVMLDAVESDSIGLTVTSPPFPGMYAYSNSTHDMGNTRNHQEMLDQFRYLIPQLLRVTMPGRLCAIHLTQSPAFKHSDGYIGLKDFRGDVIRLMESEAWIYFGEVTIDKDPQVKASRTKEQSLLFKTLAQDAANCRMAMADYLLLFKKPGDNPRPIKAGSNKRYNPDAGWITDQEWIEWAAPCWYRASKHYPGGIRETDVLNVAAARESDDERHLCPLQLGVIERAIKLWSAPGDTILDPFNGIGSTGYQALKLHRRYIGVELKQSYFTTARKNLERAEREMNQGTLWGLLDEQEQKDA